jgi:DNA primase catalytic core
MKSRDLLQLKKKTDLVAVAQARGLALTRQGQDYVARCPFHEETSPSFHITPSKNLFHCFGCGAAGSVLDFVMRMDGIPFKAAVDKLLTETGVVQRAAETPQPAEAPSLALASERAALLLARVTAIYQKNLAETAEGRAYLEKRGITDAALWTRHRIGYSNGKLTELLPKQGAVWDELKTLGILLSNGQERFAGCVVFPVTDAEGNPTTIYGRYTGEGEKRHLYLPGRPTGLWNAVALKTYAHVVLVESILDALSVQMAGSQNVISIQGTNGLNAGDVATLASYGLQRITLLMDGDEPGRTGTAKLQTLLSSFSCESRELPQEHDPNSYLLAHGPKGLAQVLADGHQTNGDQAQARPDASTPPGVQPIPGGFALTLGLRRYEIRGLEKGPRKLKATVRVEHAGKLHVDTLDFYSARWRRQLAQDLTRLFDESADAIEADMARLMALCEHLPEVSAATATPSPAETMTPEARKGAEDFGQRPDLVDQILGDYERCGLIGERANKLLCYLAMSSRKLEKPLSVLVLSSSGAGKTALQDAAVLFCPPEDLVKLTSLSGKALFYKEQSSLKRKVLALEEGDGVEEATYALRNLISAGELVIEATIKDQASGKLTTMENRVEGPTAVFVTTTNPDTDAETRSRFWVTSIDESKQQTQAILAYQRKRQTLAGLADTTAQEPILSKHHNFQRLLKPVAVVNPYADQLSYGDDRLQSRRDQPKYLALIKAVALLRQLQKPVKVWGGNGSRHANGPARPYIEVDREDIRLANELTTELLGQTLDELSRPGYDLLMQLERMTQAEPASSQAAETAKRKSSFTRRQIREATGWSQARVHRYLQELIELEYVLVESGRNGQLQTYRLLYDGQGKDGKKFVLGLKPVEALKEPTV